MLNKAAQNGLLLSLVALNSAAFAQEQSVGTRSAISATSDANTSIKTTSSCVSKDAVSREARDDLNACVLQSKEDMVTKIEKIEVYKSTCNSE